MESGPAKRKADLDSRHAGSNKRAKAKKKWSVPRKDAAEARAIQPGDMGIWATCAMNKEAPTVSDLRHLFQEYASQIYGHDQDAGAGPGEDSDEGEGDIENEIRKEIQEIQQPATEPLFRPVKLDTQCLVFFKSRPPVEPVSFVHKICQDTVDGVAQKGCRFVKRLTPISAIDKATDRGLDDVARQVLAPHFHGPDQAGKKFAIRVSIRNNKQFTRDEVIRRIAAAVGHGHKVDLSGYDLLILVEIYQNVVGMSVVGSDFEKLKRFNLAELRDACNARGQKAAQDKDEAA